MCTFGVTVTTSTGKRIDFIQMTKPSEQHQWVLHLTAKHPTCVVKPVFWKGGKWVTR